MRHSARTTPKPLDLELLSVLDELETDVRNHLAPAIPHEAAQADIWRGFGATEPFS